MTSSCTVRQPSERFATPQAVRRTVSLTAVCVLAAVAVCKFRGHTPDLDRVGAVVREADTSWLVAATTATFISADMFARHQRSLLSAIGVTLPHHDALALSYSRAAMAYSLPAGSAVSAAYAYQQFHARGADRRSAATILVLSGSLLLSALVALCSVGLLAAAVLDEPDTQIFHPAITVAAAAALAVTVTLIIRFACRSVRPRHLIRALAAAIANWSAELLCLIFVAYAFGLSLGILSLGAGFLSAQVARQIPLTPGGIGVVEASLLTSLIAAGAPTATAAAVVLAYRALSCWLVIGIGLPSWLLLRSRTHTSNSTDLINRVSVDKGNACQPTTRTPVKPTEGSYTLPKRRVNHSQH